MIINKIRGTGMAVKGDDIDTDRIMPARYLKELTFNNLGNYVFFDEREEKKKQNQLHPFDDPKFKTAKFLIVNSNFGCGSSREHAPQGIKRWGVDCIIGVSFSEIFYSNCCAIGLPCLQVSTVIANQIQSIVTESPETEITLNLEQNDLLVESEKFDFEINEGVKQSFVNGNWDATQELLSAKDQINTIYNSLFYTKN